MNIYENLKNDREVIGKYKVSNAKKLGPCDSIPTLHPYDKFLMDAKLFIWTTKMQNFCPQSLTHLGYVKFNGYQYNL